MRADVDELTHRRFLAEIDEELDGDLAVDLDGRIRQRGRRRNEPGGGEGQ